MRKFTLRIILSAFIFSSYSVHAQAPDTAWTKTIGGLGNDNGRWIQETSDGGFIITGITASSGAGQNDAWLIKTDSDGISQWMQTYGGSNQDYGFTVQQSQEGNYTIGGQTLSFGSGGMDAWLIKTDAQGITAWTKTYGTNVYELGYGARQTLDGGYIICSQTSASGAGALDIWLIKADSLGEIEWTQTYGGSDNDWGRFAQQTSDSGYVILGQTESYGAGGYDLYVIKTSMDGDTVWTNTYGGMSSDYTASMQQTSEGGYVILATSPMFSAGGHDAWLIKTDANGDTLWTRAYGGAEQEDGYFILQTSDGGYILTGATLSYGNGGRDVFVVRVNALGDTLWTKTIGGTGDEIGYCIQETQDGGYIIVGQTDSYGAGGDDLWLIKLDPEPAGISSAKNPAAPEAHSLYQNYPNPFNPTTRISWRLPVSGPVKLTIYDLTGKTIVTLLDGWYPAGAHAVEWDASNLASGVYLYRLHTDHFAQTRKMLLLR